MYQLKTPEEIENISEYIEEWKKIRQEVLEVLERIPEENFQKIPKKGWSASLISEHLFLTQYFFAYNLPVVLQGKRGYSKEELKKINHKQIIEVLSKPFSGIKNPDIVTPKKNWDKYTSINNLNKSMNLFIKYIKDYDINQLKERGMLHGIFGPISLLDFIFNLIVHEKGHLEALKLKFLSD